MERLNAQELAEYADTGWNVRYSKKAPRKLVAAVEPTDSPDSDNGGDGELLTDTVAAVPAGKPSSKRGKPLGNNHVAAPSKQQSSNNQPFICFNHCHWRKEAWECAYPKHGKFEGNGKAGGH